MEKTDAPDVLPVILGGDIGAYSIARAFHEAYGIVPLVLSQAACHLCGDSSILANRVVPHLERPAVLLSTLANTAECFGDRPLLLLGCGDWYVRLIVENRSVLEKSFIIPYIDEELLNRLTEKDRFYALCAEVGVPVPRTVVFDARTDGDDPAGVALPFPFPVVAKPASSAAYHYADFPGKQKVFFLRDAAELQSTLAAVQASRYEGKFLIQEMIPGDDTSMRILTTYSDRNGKVRFASFGQTLLEDMRPMGGGQSARHREPHRRGHRGRGRAPFGGCRLHRIRELRHQGGSARRQPPFLRDKHASGSQQLLRDRRRRQRGPLAYGRPRAGPTPARGAHRGPQRVAVHGGAQSHAA